MAKLAEVGVFYPCATKGIEIPIDDEETTMQAGDVLEAQWVADRDLNLRAAFEVIHEVLRMKEEYPYFVWHGLKIETRRITVQFSIAPSGQTTGNPGPVTGLIWTVVWAVGIILAAVVAAYAAILALYREYWLPEKPQQGDVIVWTEDSTNKVPLPNVKVSVAGQMKTTGPNGDVLFKDITVGTYTIFGETLDGYHPPDTRKVTVKDKEVSEVKIQYFDSAQPKPEHGYVWVYTEPVTGEVAIGNVPYGPAPVGPIQLPAGDTLAVSYSHVEGYITPPIDIFTVPRAETEIIVGKYKLPPYDEEPWYDKYVKYALIGGGVIIGTAILIPELIRSVPRRGKEKK